MTSAPSSLPDPRSTAIVLDASAAVEALLGTPLGAAVRMRMRGCELNAPDHLDAEVLSALGRLHRAQSLEEVAVVRRLAELAAATSRPPPADVAGGGARRGSWRVDPFARA